MELRQVIESIQRQLVEDLPYPNLRVVVLSVEEANMLLDKLVGTLPAVTKELLK